jgi:hypothetical protein
MDDKSLCRSWLFQFFGSFPSTTATSGSLKTTEESGEPVLIRAQRKAMSGPKERGHAPHEITHTPKWTHKAVNLHKIKDGISRNPCKAINILKTGCLESMPLSS